MNSLDTYIYREGPWLHVGKDSILIDKIYGIGFMTIKRSPTLLLSGGEEWIVYTEGYQIDEVVDRLHDVIGY